MNHRSPFKGVILAAGIGSRLKPLTDDSAKPLLPFCDVPMLYLAMSKLVGAGISHLATNSHHQHEKIQLSCNENPFSLNVHVSYEKELLGSGGVYGNLRSWAGKSDLVAINGDIVTDFSIRRLLESHGELSSNLELEDRSPLASLGLVKGKNPKGNSIWVNQKSQVIAIDVDILPEQLKTCTPYMFSGIQVISNRLVSSISENCELDIIQRYREELKKGEFIGGFHQDCFWHDLGTPNGFIKAHQDFLSKFFADPDSIFVEELGLLKCFEALNRELIFTCPHSVYLQDSIVNIDMSEFSGIKLVTNNDLKYEATGYNMISEGCDIAESSKIGPFAFLGRHSLTLDSSAISNSVLFDQYGQKHKRNIRNCVVKGDLVVKA